MAKKTKKNSGSKFIVALSLVIAGVLMMLALFLPVVTYTYEGQIINVEGKVDGTTFNLFNAKKLQSDEEIEENEYSDADVAAEIFFATEEASKGIGILSVFTLVAGILGAIAIIAGVASLFVDKVFDYIKYYGILLFVVGLLVFIFGLVFAGVETVLAGGNYAIAIGTILAFVGGVVGLSPAVLPIVLKK